jgi:hypothetical protein
MHAGVRGRLEREPKHVPRPAPGQRLVGSVRAATHLELGLKPGADAVGVAKKLRKAGQE